ncbi:MAG TPA: hypothetical protein EYP05_03360 [Piscirickettsiaceae bacterium]|nr:hypothetical protein [Piscirickettsiaceae bacterium]HIQ39679.1 hypothetical protein [Sulfurivirga caldicuralii]
MKWVSLSPCYLGSSTTVPVAPLQTLIRWAAFAYLVRKDKAFAHRMAREVLGALEDLPGLQQRLYQALDEALPWLAAFVAQIEAQPPERVVMAFAEKLDVQGGKVLTSTKTRFTDAVFTLPWTLLSAAEQHWLQRAFVSWSEAIASLQIKALNRTFPAYAPFVVDVKQQLKRTDFVAFYLDPFSAEEEIWVAFARIPTVRQHLADYFDKGKGVQTLWVLPDRHWVANWLVLSN